MLCNLKPVDAELISIFWINYVSCFSSICDGLLIRKLIPIYVTLSKLFFDYVVLFVKISMIHIAQRSSYSNTNEDAPRRRHACRLLAIIFKYFKSVFDRIKLNITQLLQFLDKIYRIIHFFMVNIEIDVMKNLLRYWKFIGFLINHGWK